LDYPIHVGEDLTMEKYTMADLVKTKQHAEFVEKLVDQAHADIEIANILGIESETPDQTKEKLLKNTRFPFASTQSKT